MTTSVPPLESSHVEFVGELKRSRLLSDAQWGEIAKRSRQSSDPIETARHLVREGWLTAFQAEQIVLGRGNWLSLGSYQVLRPLSEGGVGRVFLGRRIEDGQQVAIKLLRESRRGNPRARQRFRIEAHVLLTQSHKNLLRGLDFEDADAATSRPAYQAVEFIAGPNLRELLAIRRHLPWEVACDMASQAAFGLSNLHDHHIVHRDIKPSNLMALASGRVKVIDFGMALCVGDDPALRSPPPKSLGFVDYVAPEQLADREHVDGRADIYSLGCTLFYLLTGRAPVRLAPRSGPPPSLVRLREDVPKDLEAIVHRMLAADPNARYADMHDVCAALQPFAKRAALIIDYPALLRARAQTTRVQTGGVAMLEQEAKTESAIGIPHTSRSGAQLIGLTQLVDQLIGELTASRKMLAEAETKHAAERRRLEQDIARLGDQLRASEAARAVTDQKLSHLEQELHRAVAGATLRADEVAAQNARLLEQAEDDPQLRNAYEASVDPQEISLNPNQDLPAPETKAENF